MNNSQSQIFEIPSENVEKVAEKICDTTEYLCDTCEVVFTHLDKFINHVLQEHKIQKEKILYDCAQCYRSFQTALLFEDHIQDKIYKCEFCDKFFPIKNYLCKHIRVTHKGNTDHKCIICGKSFLNGGHLKKHINTVHDSSRDNKCELCGTLFSTASGLKKHIHTVHEG